MLDNYAVLKGRVSKDLEDHVGRTMTHYNLIVGANGVEYQLNIDVQSSLVPNVKMMFVEEFDGKILSFLDKLGDEGLFMLGEYSNDYRLDYLRSGAIRGKEFANIKPRPWEELSNMLDQFFKTGNVVYCLGDYYDDTQHERLHMPHGLMLRQRYSYLPSRGIHDAHMNQGVPLTMPQCRSNGIYQDGGVLIRADDNKVKGLFFVFTSQILDTDEQGNPVE